MSKSLQMKTPLHPQIALILTFSIMLLGIFIAKDFKLPIMLGGLILVYLVFGFGFALLKDLLIIVPTSLLIGVITYLVRRDIAVAVGMWGRIAFLGLCALPLITLPYINLVRWLTQVRCPRMITLGMLIAMRFIPILIKEVKTVREAMKTRGVYASLLNFKCFYRALLMPLMLRIINMSDTLSLSLETRCFDITDSDVTIYKAVNKTVRDYLFCVTIFALIAIVGVM